MVQLIPPQIKQKYFISLNYAFVLTCKFLIVYCLQFNFVIMSARNNQMHRFFSFLKAFQRDMS